jgi:micrococcal nuclease
LKSQLPSQILIQIGLQALHYVLSVAPTGTTVTIITEKICYLNYWHRQWGYVILPDGNCMNELVLTNGYARATNEYDGSRLAPLLLLNSSAQLKK